MYEQLTAWIRRVASLNDADLQAQINQQQFSECIYAILSGVDEYLTVKLSSLFRINNCNIRIKILQL